MSDDTVLPVYDEGNFTHIASVEEKTLAALERIEELLTAQLEGLRFLAKTLKPEVTIKVPAEAPVDERVKVAPRRGR